MAPPSDPPEATALDPEFSQLQTSAPGRPRLGSGSSAGASGVGSSLRVFVHWVLRKASWLPSSCTLVFVSVGQRGLAEESEGRTCPLFLQAVSVPSSLAPSLSLHLILCRGIFLSRNTSHGITSLRVVASFSACFFKEL